MSDDTARLDVGRITQGWQSLKYRLRRDILRNPAANALYTCSDRAIRDLTAEVIRLRNEIDARSDVPVLHCLERDAAAMRDQSRDELPGTIMRATDTGREWVSDNGGWEET